MKIKRVICFVDGLNLYHSLEHLKKPHLKWLDLQTLFHRLIRPRSDSIAQIFIFTAHPTWNAALCQHNHLYVAALVARGVTPILGRFHAKQESCFQCRAKWITHKEKESDVNLAVSLIDLAYKNAFDKAYVLSRDSDLAPAIRAVKQGFPDKKITVLSLFNCTPSQELLEAADEHKTVKLRHITASLFPDRVYDGRGELAATRPEEYNPPKDFRKRISKKQV